MTVAGGSLVENFNSHTSLTRQNAMVACAVLPPLDNNPIFLLNYVLTKLKKLLRATLNLVLVPDVLLQSIDREMVERIKKHLENRGVEFYMGAKAQSFSMDNDNKIIVQGLTKEKEGFAEVFDWVILDVGRCANTHTINLEKLGIQIEPKFGKVVINDRYQTTVSNIFAIGDCSTHIVDICPLAKKEGKLLARKLYKMSDINVDYHSVPYPIFTTLEYGFVGMTEEKARELYPEKVEVYHDYFQPHMSRPSHRFDSRSFTKMITVKTENEGEIILGIHILGPNAGEIVQGYALALKLKATKECLDSLASVFPTNGEFVNNLSVTKSSGVEIGIR